MTKPSLFSSCPSPLLLQSFSLPSYIIILLSYPKLNNICSQCSINKLCASEPIRFFNSFSGLWHRLVLWYDTNVSEDHAASIFSLLVCYVMQCCGRIPMFQSFMLPPFSVIWFVMSCSVVVRYQCFRTPCSLHFQSSGLLCHVVLWSDTSVSEVHAASIFSLLSWHCLVLW
jgi:hypothetical protein